MRYRFSPRGLVALALLLGAALAQGQAPAWREHAYGSQAQQRLQVLAPGGAGAAPVLFILGDVGDDAARHWQQRGLALVRVQVRNATPTNPQMPVEDLQQALLRLRQQAGAWGLDRERVVLLGHGEGARLFAALAAQMPLDHGADPLPWLGSVLLGGGAWPRPTGAGAPVLMVCPARSGWACPAAERQARSLRALGTQAEVVAQAQAAPELGAALGVDMLLTARLELFLRGLDPVLDQRLAPP